MRSHRLQPVTEQRIATAFPVTRVDFLGLTGMTLQNLAWDESALFNLSVEYSVLPFGFSGPTQAWGYHKSGL